MVRFCSILLLLNIFWVNSLTAQLHQGGVPESFARALPPDEANVVIIDPPALDSVIAEDLSNPVPYRFAVNLPVDIGFENLDRGVVSSSSRDIRRLTVHAPGAIGLTLYFDKFEMPAGAKLFIYNPQRTQLLGAFTSMNNNRSSTFATSLIIGDKLTLEYNAPVGADPPLLHISELAWAYRGIGQTDGVNTGFGASGKCEVNANCNEGTDWQKQKRGVTRIQIKRGAATLFCTGSVVNNTLNDSKPYILTADHCGRFSSELDLTKWIFYFNYEAKGCPNPSKEPWLSSITGSTLVSHGGAGGSNGSDFFLVLLESAIPDSFNVHYNGWSRDTNPSQSGVTIHHPQGDIKKISTYNAPLQPAYWSGDSKLAHWRVTWIATENGHATTENGSSGSPLFDAGGHIVGTLTGGDSSCDSSALLLPDYYGMFSYHWDKNGTDSTEQLKPWLDPIQADVLTLNGWALSVNDHAREPSVAIYPNPVNDQLHVKISIADVSSIYFSVLDLFGNLILMDNNGQAEGFEYRLKVASLKPGLYFLKIGIGDTSMIRKFVKN